MYTWRHLLWLLICAGMISGIHRQAKMLYFLVFLCYTARPQGLDLLFRGCTGFDGGFEALGAIRRPWLRKKTEPKYKR